MVNLDHNKADYVTYLWGHQSSVSSLVDLVRRVPQSQTKTPSHETRAKVGDHQVGTLPILLQ